MPVCAACGRENPEGFRFCGVCGAEFAAPATERRKLATMLFCDMSGSTALGERVDAESVRDLLFRYFHTMRDAIERHGGMVEKFIGDAVEAVFGVPVAHEDDALRAVRAAAEMRERLAELNGELEERFGTRIAIRIGVNTGEVVAGDGSSRQTIVTGDAVNVAARLEQHAGADEILLGEPTYRLVREAVAVEPVEPIAAKGKSKPVAAYRLLSVSGEVPARRHAAPLVGRGAELALLRAAFDEVASTGRSRVMTIVGEPGVGKSRLAGEFLGHVAGYAVVLEGRCLAYGEGITYWPLAEIVRQAAGIHDEDSSERALERLTALAEDEIVGRRVAQAIGAESGEAAAEEIAWAIRRLLAAVARERPAIVLVDDIQWAEQALLDLLASLPALEDAPVLVVCLARPELLDEHPEWDVAIRLETLEESDAARLVPEGLAGVRDRILRTAGGNPLFVEELVAFLSEKPDAGALPPSLSALLGARLDRLPEHERSALEHAAVEGEVFHRGSVAALADRDVSVDLDRLAAADFIRAAQAQFVDEAAFRFRHLLVRDAAYAATPKKLRAQLHERFADWLERKAADRLGEVDAILGYHLERAWCYRTELGPPDRIALETAERAALHLASAGQRAAARGDWPAVANLLGRACELGKDGPERPHLLYEFGLALGKLGRNAEGERILAEAAASAAAVGDRGLELLAQIDLAFFGAERIGPTEGFLAVCKSTVRELEAEGDDRRLAHAWARLCAAYFWMGKLAEAVDAGERALAHTERSGSTRERADVLEWLMMSMWEGPTPVSDFLPRFEEALRSFEHEPMLAWFLLAGVAQAEAALGRHDDAREKIDRSLAISAELGLEVNHLMTALQLALVELDGGDLRRAERKLNASFERLIALDHVPFAASLASMLGEVTYRLGELDEAARWVDKALELGEDDDFVVQIESDCTRARLAARGGDPATGEVFARRAVERAFASDVVDIRARSLQSLAQVLQHGGKIGEAVDTLRRALAILEAKGDLVAAAWTRDRLAEIEAEASTR